MWDYLDYDKEGNLHINGLKIVDIAQATGTPLEIVDTRITERRAKEWISLSEKVAERVGYKGGIEYLYASKADPAAEITTAAIRSGWGIETSSALDLGEAEAEVAEMELMVEEALRDKEEAKSMLLRQARELEKLARKDSRLVARVRISEMKEQSLELKEAMLNLIPDDADNMRSRAIEMSKKKKARVDSRSEIVDALWQQKRRGEIARDMQTTARGAQILRAMQSEVGYAPATVPASIEEAETEEIQKKASAN